VVITKKCSDELLIGLCSFRGSGFAVCEPQIAPCTKSKYRTYDGSCNNLDNPSLGVANTRYGRLLPKKYSDGTSEGLPTATFTVTVMSKTVSPGNGKIFASF
jgi:hypothetical protein